VHRDKQKLLDDVFLQPWFVPQETALAIRALVPEEQRHKMRFYFEDYGCLSCNKKRIQYGSNGMCKACVGSVKLKMLFAIQRRWKRAGFTEHSAGIRRIAEAKNMLRDLVNAHAVSRL